MRAIAAWSLLILATPCFLVACSTLPEDGPSARRVIANAKPEKKPSYALVDVDYRVTQVISANPITPLASLRQASSTGPNDLIAVGDSLAVSIFQPGAGPMSLGAQATPARSRARSSSATQNLPRIVVDDSGAITVPFGGAVSVINLTPRQAGDAIRRALRGKMADPQVMVSSISSPRNSVIVIGEVRQPGRFQLVANSDRLLDALASAGGPTKAARDLTVTIVRGDQSATISLATLLDDPAENIRLGPRDQIRVTPSPRKIDVFGAVGKGSEIPIEDDTLSLAGALARIGGLNGNLADAKSVLVFRFERPEVAKALGIGFPATPGLKGVPVIYRVNLRDPAGYFVAGKFEVVANDLVYVPTADVAELQKFLLIVNSAAQFFYDAAVAKTL